MSEDNGVEVPTTPASPSDRQRKKSIVFSSQPSISDDNIVIDTGENEIHNTDDPGEHTHTSPDATPEVEKHINEKQNEHNQETTSNCMQVRDQVNEENNNVAENVLQLNDIVYDETKPKRLRQPNPKKLKIELNENSSKVMQDSINYLISPDIEREDSPRSRKKKQFDCETNELQLPKQNGSRMYEQRNSKQETDYKRKLSDTLIPSQKAMHYQRSPEPHRKFPASPIEKLITKSGSPKCIHQVRRKMSSDASLQSSKDRSPPCNQTPPRRRISSGARLEFIQSDDCPTLDVNFDQLRKRKVSFDTTALINGNEFKPLNDEHIVPEVHELVDDHRLENENHEGGFVDIDPEENLFNRSVPKLVISMEEDTTNEESVSSVDIDHTVNIEDTGYINKAYKADDEYSLPSNSSTPPPGYQEYAENQMKSVSSNGQSNEIRFDSPAVISYTDMSDSMPSTKKCSTISLPAGLGYRNGSRQSSISENGGTPKSILKTRRDDTESVASIDSIQNKKFKVRKDSIALFTDKNGGVELQELRKQYSKPWKRFGKGDIKELWANRRHLLEKYKLHLLVFTLFSFTLSFVIVGLHFHSVHHKKLATSQKIFFEARPKQLTLYDVLEHDTLTGSLGINIPSWHLPSHCYANYKTILDKSCLRWKNEAQLDIAHFIQNRTQCYNISWLLEPDKEPYDCFDLGNDYWYGPVNMSESQWPIKNSKFEFTVTKAKQFDSGTFSAAVEYYWLSSDGHAIILDPNFPVEISWNTRKPGKVCVIGKKSGDFYHTSKTKERVFKYTVCNGLNVHDTNSMVRNQFLPKTYELPERSLMKYPHWSSGWDSDHLLLNESVVMQLAESLSTHKLNCSTIELDGKWENRYGDYTFSELGFNNMTKLVDTVSKSSCELSLNVYPFFNFHSKNFNEGLSRDYFVKNVGKTVPALVNWQHGVGAMLDVSNPSAREWLTMKIRHLISNYNISTFRFTYGLSAWVPHSPIFYVDNVNPNKIKQMFSELLSSLGNTITQSTAQTQHLTSLISVPVSVETKQGEHCLKNIIPDVLILGMMGYPFVMADGFSIEKKHNVEEYSIPSRDLFIRWMQLATFLPAMKYTVKPWSYDNEVVEAARNATVIHSTIVLDAIYKAESEILDGMPIILPLWWNTDDLMTLTINDEFLVVGKYLVAPILCECKVEHDIAERDIYVPKGIWKDLLSEDVFVGPKWYRRYQVKQFEIPLFEKLSDV